MRHVFAAVVLTALPVAAQAAAFAVQNCSTTSMATVIAFEPVSNTSSNQVQLSPGRMGTVSCGAEGCWLQIIYFGTGEPVTVGTFRGPYSSDRCTRGPVDVGAGDLPAAGGCGC